MMIRVLVVLAGLGIGAAAQQAAAPPKLDIPKNMKAYFVATLVAASEPKTLPKEEAGGLTYQHLAYIRSQVEAGKYLVVGPFTDNGKIRGMAIVSAASMDEARRILEADPMVTSGQMTIEIHPAVLPDLSGVKTDYPAK